MNSRSSRFKPVEIGNLDGTRAVLEAIPEEMTAFGGVPMLAAVEKEFGLVAELSKLVHDRRAQHMVKHEKYDIMLQRSCQIALGFPDGNDCDFLRMDAAIMAGFNRDPVSGKWGVSQEGLSRFESKAVDRQNVKAVREVFVNHFIRVQRKRLKKVVLDCDGSMIKTYGAQEGSIYRGGKYNHTMYFPLKIFCGDWLLATVLRSGDQSEAKTILDSLKMVVGKLRDKWPRLKVKVRLDAAFGSPALYDWLRRNRIGYEIGMASNSVLDSYAKTYKKMAEEQFRNYYGEPMFTGKDWKKRAQAEHARIGGIEDPAKRMAEEKALKSRRVRIVGEFAYKPEKWKNWERVICRVDFTDKGFDIHYVVVSVQVGIPQRIYEEEYCKRGLAEQCIGRFKQTGQRLSAQQFHANQFRLTMYGVAYMLLVHMRDNYASQSLRRSDVETMRKKLLLMPMLIRRTEKKIVFQISENHINAKEFFGTWRRISAA